jgi:LuxR family maltose regulon positive regulatory protein
VADELSYLREFEHITFARVLLAQARIKHEERALGDALRLLNRLLKAAEAAERTGSTLEILVLLALAQQARGDACAGVELLQRALDLVEPEGYVRIFVDEGEPLTDLLQVVARDGVAWDYARRLRAAAGRAAAGPTHIAHGTTEPLSDRELDVLRLLATDLDGPDIARELVVSLNTMRTHTRSIYGKLGVNSRAEELELLSRR